MPERVQTPLPQRRQAGAATARVRVIDLGRRRLMEPIATTTHRCHSWTKPVTAVGNPVIGIPTESAPASFEQDRRGGCSSQVWTRDAERVAGLRGPVIRQMAARQLTQLRQRLWHRLGRVEGAKGELEVP